jgi:hypothetical protein
MTQAPSEGGIYLRRTSEGFIFASEYDRRLAERYAVGSIVRADIHQPRSGKHNRWYRALVRAIWQHQDYYASPEDLHKFLKWRLGEWKSIKLKNGEVLIDFHSTSYDSMDEGDFHEHVMRAWDVITKEIIPGLDDEGRKTLLIEIDQLLRGSR